MIEKLGLVEAKTALSFSREQKVALEAKGFTFFEIKGKTIASLKKGGVSFWSTWHEDKPVEKLEARTSEIAINPNNLFLTNSANKPLSEQLVLTDAYSKQLSTEIPGVIAVMGSAVDYLCLVNVYKERTERNLFRQKSGSENVATTSLWSGHALFVGEFLDGSLVVSYRFGEAYNDIKVVPLIVPSEA